MGRVLYRTRLYGTSPVRDESRMGCVQRDASRTGRVPYGTHPVQDASRADRRLSQSAPAEDLVISAVPLSATLLD